MSVLVSVNVGLPRDIEWQGETVHTGIWKEPVAGRVIARRLNLDGDGQGDLGGHGGEHRAVMVYQTSSYRYWEQFLGRSMKEYGLFGENLTVDGMPDAEVRIGDRYRIGTVLLEVTQPRVTCYRVGIRTGVPEMPTLLVAHHRPGFYCRVIEEGTLGAGDAIVQEHASDGLTVAEVDALLYLSDHPAEMLERAVRMPALSEGWRHSFKAMLAAPATRGGNAGLASTNEDPPAWAGFREVRVIATRMESPRVRSFIFASTDEHPLPPARPGQFLALRIDRPDGTPLLRSYSISDGSQPGQYRISVKRATGAGSQYLHDHIREGALLSISAPRGSFTLLDDDRPVVLWSAGIGATPLLAMLHALAERKPRKVFWVYGARDGSEHPFAVEVRDLLRRLPDARAFVAYSQPAATDRPGETFDFKGHVTLDALAPLGIPRDACFYLCGPAAFMDGARQALRQAGYADPQILSELFGGAESMRPGIIGKSNAAPHLPPGPEGDGPVISFVRSGLSVRWSSRYKNLLDLAEACDVPVRWSCRSGVCHTCETGLVGGQVHNSPTPLQPPADGVVLICCSQPDEDVQLDL